jgi:hypothetical protein
VKLQDAVRLAKHASKHANVDNAKRFAQHVVPEIVRPAHVAWNQAIGVLFLVLACLPLKAVNLYQGAKTDFRSWVFLAASSIFFIVMVSFGISSFLKARRIAARVRRP